VRRLFGVRTSEEELDAPKADNAGAPEEEKVLSPQDRRSDLSHGSRLAHRHEGCEEHQVNLSLVERGMVHQ